MTLDARARAPGASPSGQGLVEYALIIVLVAIVVIAALLLLGPVVGNAFSTVNNSLTNL
jgi:pilus assembly protein Flp/PilA